ncbi:MAG: hypothetical protein KKA81_06170, partial [Bacteroidetes bacterium]|nr:hypothetical protein [Bacteroidota bacterium]
IRYVYNDSTGLAFEPLMVVPLDANKNNRADPKELIFGSLPQLLYSIDKGYLDPGLIRNLYLLVNTGNLKKSAYDFLHWVLDSGQFFVEEAGYISLHEDELDNQMILLDSISSFVVSDKNKIKPLKP